VGAAKGKLYYSISEVCERTDLKPHVLRYWETAFPMLRPSKNKAGNRVYRSSDVKLVKVIKRLLYEDKFTVDGARKKLEEMTDSNGQLELGFDDPGEMVAELEEICEEIRDMMTLLKRDPMEDDTSLDENGGSG
jgi:DNA-binding transcriptional MerR regulator